MTTYNNKINTKDQSAIRRFLNGDDYQEVADLCGVSFSTVNNIVNGKSKVMKHNYKVYLMLINKCVLELDESEMLYRKHLKQILL